MAKKKRKIFKKRNQLPLQQQRLYGFYLLPDGDSASYDVENNYKGRAFVEYIKDAFDGHIAFQSERGMMQYVKRNAM
jgi:hypothetical protein